MWSVSWLKGTNNREKIGIIENYFKMMYRGGIHGYFTLFLCHRKHGYNSKMYTTN